MSNLEIMDRFRVCIGKINHSLKGWIVLWWTAILTILLSGDISGDATDGALRWIFFGAGILIICMAVRRYLAKFTKIYVEETASAETTELSNVSFTDLMNCHAFDAASYYGILMKRLLPLMTCSWAIVILAWPLGLLEPSKAIVGSMAFWIVPPAVILLAWRYMAWSMSHAGALNVLDVFMSAIGSFVEILVVGFVHVMIVLKPIVMIEQHLLLDGVDGSVPVMWGCDGVALMIMLVVIVIALSLLLTDTVRLTNFSAWIKTSKKLIVGLLISLFAVAGLFLFVMLSRNVRITEDDFTVRSGRQVKVYGLDDVTTYRVYDAMDTLAMELTFSDGRKVSLFGSVSEETKGWSEKYFSNYNYAAELMQRLLEKGITGSMEDKERLEKTVSTLDPKCQEGFYDMMEILQLK